MDPAQLIAVAAARADELPGSVRENPFGPEWDVYKVRGRVFLLAPLDGTGRVTLKSHPEDAIALRESFADIVPGYHLNKKHWITLVAGGGSRHRVVPAGGREAAEGSAPRRSAALRQARPLTAASSVRMTLLADGSVPREDAHPLSRSVASTT